MKISAVNYLGNEPKISFASKMPQINILNRLSGQAYFARIQKLSQCQTMAEAKRFYPEFKDVIELSEYKGKKIPLLELVKARQIAIYPPETFSLSMLQQIYCFLGQKNLMTQFVFLSVKEITLALEALGIKLLPQNHLKKLLQHREQHIPNMFVPVVSTKKSFLNANVVLQKLLDKGHAVSEGVKREIQTANYQKEDITIREAHQRAYAGLEYCKSLSEIKECFPEFKDVLNVRDLKTIKGTYLDRLQKKEIEGLSPELFAMDLLKLIYLELKSSKEIMSEMKITSDQLLRGVLNNLKIKLLNQKYAYYLKHSDPEFQSQYSKQAREKALQVYNQRPELREQASQRAIDSWKQMSYRLKRQATFRYNFENRTDEDIARMVASYAKRSQKLSPEEKKSRMAHARKYLKYNQMKQER